MTSGGYTVKLSPGTHISESCYCPHCKLLLKNAVQTGDGDRLCETCFKTIVDMPGHACKECGIKVDPREHYPDFASCKEISKVNVLCHNTDQGCGWSGLLKDMDTHLEECGYKKVKCDLCHEGVLARYIAQHMANECPERTINCGYCSARVISKELQEHYGVCKDCPEDCSYCQQKVPRSKMDNHLADDCTHNCCVSGYVVKETPAVGQSEGVFIMQETLKEHSSELVDCQKELIIRDIHRRLAKVEAEQSRQAAELSGRPVWQSGPWESGPPAGKGVEQELNVVKAQLKRLTERLELLESSKNYDITPLDREREGQFGGSGMSVHAKLKFLEEKILEEKILEDFFQMKDDIRKLYEMLNATFKRVCQIDDNQEVMQRRLGSLELQLQASLASSFNGTFVWRIPDVGHRIREAKSGRMSSIYSPPYYTGRTGYKMCIRAYLNGDGIGENSHLSLFFVIMRGEYDPLLGWPFDHKVSLILIDQEHNKHLVQTFKPNPSSSSFQLPKSEMNVASGYPQFCALSVLNDPSYVKDDVMFIKSIVDTSKISHP